MSLHETLPTLLRDAVPDPGSDIDVADIVTGAVARGLRLRRRRRLATVGQAAVVLVAVAVPVTLAISTLAPRAADHATTPALPSAATIAPQQFPPTPQQAAATLQWLLPPGSIVSDVRSNPDKAGGAAVDIDVDTGAGAHAVMADVYSAGLKDGLDCDLGSAVDPLQTCTLTTRSDGSKLRVWTESVDGWIARSAELVRADGAVITVEATNQVGIGPAPSYETQAGGQPSLTTAQLVDIVTSPSW
jgi:hypothetical protein